MGGINHKVENWNKDSIRVQLENQLEFIETKRCRYFNKTIPNQYVKKPKLEPTKI